MQCYLIWNFFSTIMCVVRRQLFNKLWNVLLCYKKVAHNPIELVQKHLSTDLSELKTSWGGQLLNLKESWVPFHISQRKPLRNVQPNLLWYFSTNIISFPFSICLLPFLFPDICRLNKRTCKSTPTRKHTHTYTKQPRLTYTVTHSETYTHEYTAQ